MYILSVANLTLTHIVVNCFCRRLFWLPRRQNLSSVALPSLHLKRKKEAKMKTQIFCISFSLLKLLCCTAYYSWLHTQNDQERERERESFYVKKERLLYRHHPTKSFLYYIFFYEVSLTAGLICSNFLTRKKTFCRPKSNFSLFPRWSHNFSYRENPQTHPFFKKFITFIQ